MLQLHLQPESHIPLYVQLRDQLRALVHSGELRTGDRIPASRELAGHLGVHRTTVANAYAELESEGLIQGHVGRGTFICSQPVKEFSQAPRTNGNGGTLRWEALFADERAEESLSRLHPDVPPGAIAFTQARPSDELFPVEEFRRCCNAVLRTEGRRLLQIGSTDGYEPLKLALMAFFRDEGTNVREEQLLITDGCQQAIDLVCKAFLRPGDAVALENPAYPGAVSIFSGARIRIHAVGVETDTVRAGHAGLNIDALETVLMQNRVKLIFVTPDFHNPTGTVLPIAERRRLLDIAARYQIPVIEDSIYARLRLRGNTIPPLKALDRSNNVIQIDSFSKISFPGLRVGWCIGPARARSRGCGWSSKPPICIPTSWRRPPSRNLSVEAALTRHLARMKVLYRRRLEALQEALETYMPEQTTWTRPDGGMSVWLTLPPGIDAGEFLIHVRERGVLFVPGRYFYSQHPQPNTLRLAYPCLDERQIVRGMQILGESLKQELRKRQRGARSESQSRVALI